MGSTKKAQYTKMELFHARVAKAIGHPARVVILQHLTNYGFARNKDLVPVLRLHDSTVVQHLQELEDAELIIELFIENQHVYKLNPKAMDKCKALEQIFQVKTG